MCSRPLVVSRKSVVCLGLQDGAFTPAARRVHACSAARSSSQRITFTLTARRIHARSASYLRPPLAAFTPAARRIHARSASYSRPQRVIFTPAARRIYACRAPRSRPQRGVFTSAEYRVYARSALRLGPPRAAFTPAARRIYVCRVSRLRPQRAAFRPTARCIHARCAAHSRLQRIHTCGAVHSCLQHAHIHACRAVRLGLQHGAFTLAARPQCAAFTPAAQRVQACRAARLCPLRIHTRSASRSSFHSDLCVVAVFSRYSRTAAESHFRNCRRRSHSPSCGSIDVAIAIRNRFSSSSE